MTPNATARERRRHYQREAIAEGYRHAAYWQQQAADAMADAREGWASNNAQVDIVCRLARELEDLQPEPVRTFFIP